MNSAPLDEHQRLPDESQRRAIYVPADQSVLVTAPPGYGKTFVMPRRIEFLIKSGDLIPPERALGLTFTNAAANEMLNRLERRISNKYLDYVDAMTFHSFCYRALRSYGNRLGLSTDFRILLESEKEGLCRSYLRSGAATDDSDSEWSRYQEWENQRVLKLDSDIERTSTNARFMNCWESYKTYQLGESEVDFNHLLWFAWVLFQNYPQILEIYRRVYKYILVDEFQDTNPLQFALLRALVHGTEPTLQRPVFIFADDWQSIYAFLGAVPTENIAKAYEHFGCREIALTEDHRTDTPALTLFGQILRRTQPYNMSNESLNIPLIVSSNPTDMASRVDDQVSEWVETGFPLHEIAVLGRTKWLLSEVADTLSHDFLNVPELKANSLERNPAFLALAELSKTENARAQKLRAVLEDRTRNMESDEGEEHILAALLNLAGNYDLRYPNLSLSERAKIMANEALLEINWGQHMRDICQDRVFLGSLHSAKGLEFRAVAIVHIEQDSFPIWRFVCKHCKAGHESSLSPAQIREKIEEEWRVFYVGVTRARDALTLFSSESMRGYWKPVSCLAGPPLWEHLDVRDERETYQSREITWCKEREKFRDG